MPPPVKVGQPLRYQQKWAFTVEVEGVVVAGFTKAGPLKQVQSVAEQHEGGSPTVVDVTPTKYKTEKVTLERGASNNSELWDWWANQKRGLQDKRNVSVVGQHPDGTAATRYNLKLCVILEFEAGDFDGKNETENVVEKLVIQPLDLDRKAA